MAAGKQKISTIRHNIRVNNRHGVWESLALNLYSPFLGLLAIRLGAGNLQVALISALPAAVSCVASFAGAALLKPVQRKKPVTCGLIIANRAFLLAIAALPLLPAHRQPWARWASGIDECAGSGHISWQSVMGDTIPAEYRGDAFAARSRLVTAGHVPRAVRRISI